MLQISVTRPETLLVGICVSTSYHQEQDVAAGNILPCVQQYFHSALYEKIPNRSKPGTTFCAYTDYTSDYLGSYTYFIGEEVSSYKDPLPDGFQKLVIPSQLYVKFTTSPAAMPEVVRGAWKKIWNMSLGVLGGKRIYRTDFEVYDERASDHNNTVLDLYVGIEPVHKFDTLSGTEPVN
jgi:predicted transcriptional regulator YdeE